MTRHRNRVVIVVGGDTPIGHAIAARFVKEGATVAVLTRPASEGAVGPRGVAQEEGRLSISVDSTCLDDLRDAVTRVVRTFGRLDHAVNCTCARSERPRPLLELGDEDWCAEIDACVTGLFLAIKCEAGAMLSLSSGGSIVNVGSTLALFGRAGQAASTASMHSLLGLTRVASAELGALGLRVNAVCAGEVEAEPREDGVTTAGSGRAHLGRRARLDEIAALVSWLCSDEASYATGAVYTIDGGASATL